MLWVPRKRAEEIKKRIWEEQRAKFRKQLMDASENLVFEDDH